MGRELRVLVWFGVVQAVNGWNKQEQHSTINNIASNDQIIKLLLTIIK